MKLSGKLVASSVIASLGGFLFGFDTVVISGAEQTIQSLWNLSDLVHGLAISAALWGTVIGSLGGGVPTDWLGRRQTLLAIGILYFVSAVWSGLANDPYSFMLARFIGGIGVGISTVAAPLYIAEIAPANARGRLAGMFQFNIVFGILVAFISNALLTSTGDNAWRWMLGVEAVPALLYTLLALRIPESPRWLISKRGNIEQAREILTELNPTMPADEIESGIARIAKTTADASSYTSETASEEAADAIDNSAENLVENAETNPYASPASSRMSPASNSAARSLNLRKPILFAFLIAFFNQLSGINAVLYFAPRIFEMTGLGEQSAMLQTIGIGVTNLVFTIVGLSLIDYFGRKTLLLLGSVGYITSLGLCSWAFFSETYSIVPACIFAFIASHAIGQGAVIWVFISEIFPNEYRALGNSLGCGTHWVFAALLTSVFPSVVAAFAPGYVFAFFSGMMVLQLIWVLAMVPETKGVPLEELERKLGVS